ncbi:MAG TPA: DoxX family protein [Pyrinomonadaceae bacterium]|nr:DoxX family protein [Pyrinomonadaceae bacterium]
MNILFWVIQALLTLTFLFSGGLKLVLPIEVLQSMGPPSQVVVPGLFLKFIGVCEVLGGLGLILPGVFHRQQYLTPLAAAGLVIIMIGAVVITIIGLGFVMAISPLITGLLCAFVAYGRWKLRPLN